MRSRLPCYLGLYGLADSQAVAEILDSTTSVSETDITRCAAPLPMNDFGGCLQLDGIDDREDLIPLLCSWQGESLVVKNCSGFNGAILEMMRIQMGGEYICAVNMDNLEIVDCPNVVNTLCLPSAEPRLEAVRVYGLVHHISQEGILWFETNGEQFDNWWCL